jgi:hypothetical protein
MSVAELAALPQWVVTYVLDKIPLDPKSGLRAAVNDPATWGTFETASACVAVNTGLTLGFVLTPNDPYICIDLDTYKTTDPVIIQKHKVIYETFNSYSELSPQGGVHIWVKGHLNAGKRLPNEFIEVYPFSRYITITGNFLNDNPIVERQVELESLVGHIDTVVGSSWVGAAQTKTDEEICKMAANASNGNLFMRLWYGDWAGLNYSSQSEGDLAFINIVAFYTDNKEQVARIYYGSPLFQNTPDHKKKKRKSKPDYLFHEKYGLVTKAFDQKNYFPELEALVKAHVDAKVTEELATPIMKDFDIKESVRASLPAFIKEPLKEFSFDELPPGLLGEIAVFIYQNAVRPVKEIAIAGAIAYLAGIAGKAFNISRTGLNHYIAILAPTAGGKEGAASGMEMLTNAILEILPAFEQFIGPAEIASPQALIKHLSVASPCFYSHKGEIGFWMQKLTSKWAKANETALRGLLLDLYTKSGYGQVVRGSIYSDKTKDVHAIKAPSFTLIGDATPDTFYRALDEENIEEGLVARFTVVEALGERVPHNELHGQIKPDKRMVHILAGIARRALQLAQINNVINIDETPEAHEEHMRFSEQCYEITLKNRESAEGKLYSRAHLRLLRLAGLIAVGINPDNPVLTIECVQWAKRFIVYGISCVVTRFETGRVGAVNYSIEQRMVVLSVLKRYLKEGYKSNYGKIYQLDEAMYNAKVITNKFIHSNVIHQSSFRKDHNANLAYKQMIAEYVENGVLERIDLARIKDSPRRGIAYYIRDVF